MSGGQQTFRLGLTRDLLSASGEPSFGRGPLALLDNDPHIEWEFLPESLSEITPDVMARIENASSGDPAAR